MNISTNLQFNPDSPVGRHTGPSTDSGQAALRAGRYPVMEISPRSGQIQGVVPLAWGYLIIRIPAFAGMTRIFSNGKSRFNSGFVLCFKRAGLVRFSSILLFCYLASFIQSSHAEVGQQRLSEWLANRTVTDDDYPLGLFWQVASEEAAQAKLKSDLLIKIVEGADSGSRNGLYQLIEKMPITGRVPVSIADSDWLRANPNHDPVISNGHRVVMPKRPHTVTLITSGDERCQLPHVAGLMAKDYLRGCIGDNVNRLDWVWVIQPDGKTGRLGVASWTNMRQDQMAPGAVVWAPYRADGWAVNLSEELAAFLATQTISDVVTAGNEVAALDAPARLPISTEVDIYDSIVTTNDWGGAGLLQTPNARMFMQSHASMTLSRSYPYTYFNTFLQPFDWMEVGFRYISVSNRLYGPIIAGNQEYKDKSIDVKLSLLNETNHIPQVAIGLRDITGTGMFSGEYIVANKRTGRFDWSLGLGWGYVGGRGNIRNPLGLIDSKFDNKRGVDYSVNQAGKFSIQNYFRGPTALFGGVQYQSNWEPLILKLEYDGNDYQHEPQKNNQRQDSPLNFGAVYQIERGMDLLLGFERGNTLLLGITLQTDLNKLSTPKLDDPKGIPFAGGRPEISSISSKTATDLLHQTGWSVSSITLQNNRINVYLNDAGGMYLNDRIDRANAVLHRDAAREIDLFSYVHKQGGIEMVEHDVDRVDWMNKQSQPALPNAQRATTVARKVHSGESVEELIYQSERSIFDFEPGFGLRYNLGGPDGFLLYQIFAEGRAKLHLREDTWLQGNLQLGLVDNYDKFKYTAPSDLPRVRTYLREYLTTSEVTLPNFQLTHTRKLSENQYFSMYGGYLETMFAGVGAEWMYRSLDSPLAFGIDVNRVRQRDFKQDFALRKYQTDTGHSTLYWDTGWNDVLANLSAGRYLAGDVGVTVEMSRIFQNGVRFGGYFTKTNVSSKQFGEGSFDKGLFVSIPFDAMLTKSNNKVANFAWKPLIRDGGAKLGRDVMLYNVTRLLDERALQYRPAELDNYIPIPSQKQPEWGVGILR